MQKRILTVHRAESGVATVFFKYMSRATLTGDHFEKYAVEGELREVPNEGHVVIKDFPAWKRQKEVEGVIFHREATAEPPTMLISPPVFSHQPRDLRH